ncbi:MAG: DUF4359 domain-containing protein [Bacteroidaceae bacterium]|nr:DUF4359 domain-containing protein [Bacteroidaceae bacterium]
MKKILFLVILAAVVVGAVVTCPDKKAHKEALADTFAEYASYKIDENKDNGLSDVLNEGLKALRKVGGDKVVEATLSQFLEVDNYYVLSIGRLKQGSEKKLISIGLFGHVFTPTSSMIDNALKGQKDQKEEEGIVSEPL